jgi:hypothetical protein
MEVIDDDYINISSNRVQNIIAYQLSKIFDLDELKLINISDIKYPPKREIKDTHNVFLSLQFESGNKFELVDVLLMNVYPPIRYLDIRIYRGKKVQIDLKCKYNDSILKYVDIILAKSINFSMYFKSDVEITTSTILSNYSKELETYNSKDNLKELKFIIAYEKDNIIEKQYYYNEFKIGETNFIISSISNLIFKFEFKKDNISRFIFLQKNKTGIHYLNSCIINAIADN